MYNNFNERDTNWIGPTLRALVNICTKISIYKCMYMAEMQNKSWGPQGPP